jgi:hypothetical protein
MWFTDPEDLTRAVQELFRRPESQLLYMRNNARTVFQDRDTAFKTAFLGSLEKVLSRPARIRTRFEQPPTRLLPESETVTEIKTYTYQYVKKTTRTIPTPRKPLPPISLVTRCMNRTMFLRQALPTWTRIGLNQIIVVDWSSTEDVQAVIDQNQDGHIYRLYIPDQEYFHRAKSLNVGMRFADGPVLAHVDADVMLNRDFFDIVDRNNHDILYNRGHFSMYGTCILSKNIFNRVNGYNEYMADYGGEDSDFYERIERLYPSKMINNAAARHIDHDDGLRLENHAVKDKMGRNERHWMKWNDVNIMEPLTAYITYPDGVKEKRTV